MVFHPVHGASLRIRSLYPELFVEPNEAEMRAFLSYIQENGISEKMKNLNFPTFPLKIAVIGASTGTGIPEFLEHL